MSKEEIDKLSDEEVISRLLQSGNTLYFEQIYRRYHKKVYYQILSYVKDTEEAEDLAQDLFIKLYDRLSRFQGKSRFSTWLFSITRNAMLDELRKKGRFAQENINEVEEPQPEVSDDELMRLRADRLAVIMDKIPADDRSLLIMKYAHEWQMDEIGELMDLSLGAVKMRLKRAKQKVKELYDAEYEEK